MMLIVAKSRYAAGDVYDVMKKLFPSVDSWKNSEAYYEDSYGGTGKKPFYISKDKQIITIPSHDAGVDAKLTTQAAPLEKTLQEVDGVFEKDTSILIPIAQSRKYLFGLIQRKHWTYLELYKDSQGKIIAQHRDSKGWLSRLYPLTPINNILKKNLGQNIQFQSSYIGHQAITDNTNCGRFIISYIRDKVNKEKDPVKGNNPQKIDNNFNKIDEIANREITNQQQSLKISTRRGRQLQSSQAIKRTRDKAVSPQSRKPTFAKGR